MRRSIEHLNIAAFAARFLESCGHVDGTGKADAGETVVFGRELEHVIAQTYDVKYAETAWRRFVPTELVPLGTDQVTYRQFDMLGEAEFVDIDAMDFPRVEIKGSEFSTGFASIGASYGYSIGDWRSAQKAGRPLDAMKARAAREVMERKLDKIACIGDTTHNLKGLSNQANVTLATVGSTTGFEKVWLPEGGGTLATPAEVYTALALAIRNVRDASKNIFTDGFTVLLPTKLMNYCTSTLFRPTYGDATLMEMLKKIAGISSIETWNRLDTAGADSKGRVVIYKRDPELVKQYMCPDFESFPPEVRSRTFNVDCHARPGTVVMPYPKSGYYIDGLGGSVS